MRRTFPAILFFAVTTACGGGPEARPVERPTTPEVPVQPAKQSGELVTYKGDQEIGRERWEDDGKVRKSTITLPGRTFTVTVDRAARRAVVETDTGSVEHAIPEGAVALENGSFQAYADLASGPAERTTKVLLPSSGMVVDARVLASAATGGASGRRVEVEFAPLHVVVVVDVDANGRVTHAEVPGQDLEVRTADAGPPGPKAPRPPPEGVEEEAFEVPREGVTLRGTIWRPAPKPASSEKVVGKPAWPPLVVFVAGSGPTDRDGNSVAGLRSDAYRMLAEALAKRGVASVRYDKRGVGASTGTFDASKVTFDDFVEDAAAVVRHARDNVVGEQLTLLGHSEGGLVALEVASAKKGPAAAPVDRLVLVATASRPLADVLHEQLATKVSPEDLAASDRIVAALRAKKDPGEIPAGLAPLYPPAVHRFLGSVVGRDPLVALRAVPAKLPVAVVQGEHDAQIPVADAKRLAETRKGAKLTIVPRMNHVFKEEPSAALPQASYTDASRPLAAGVVDEIARAVEP